MGASKAKNALLTILHSSITPLFNGQTEYLSNFLSALRLEWLHFYEWTDWTWLMETRTYLYWKELCCLETLRKKFVLAKIHPYCKQTLKNVLTWFATGSIVKYSNERFRLMLLKVTMRLIYEFNWWTNSKCDWQNEEPGLQNKNQEQGWNQCQMEKPLFEEAY